MAFVFLEYVHSIHTIELFAFSRNISSKDLDMYHEVTMGPEVVKKWLYYIQVASLDTINHNPFLHRSSSSNGRHQSDALVGIPNFNVIKLNCLSAFSSKHIYGGIVRFHTKA
jgi:hypothetical protein